MTFKTNDENVAGLLMVAVVSLFLTSGCALLTKSEVREVKAFANATKNYGTLPGGAIKAYGDISRNDRELEASARTFKTGKIAEQVRTNLEKAREADQLAEAAATSADTYRAAHAKLAAAFTKKTDFREASEEIQTLIEEIRAAQKITEDLKAK
jgi:hypothetical protein